MCVRAHSEAIVLCAVGPCGQPPGATRMAISTSISTVRLKMCAHVHVLLHLLVYGCARVLLLFKIDCTLKTTHASCRQVHCAHSIGLSCMHCT